MIEVLESVNIVSREPFVYLLSLENLKKNFTHNTLCIIILNGYVSFGPKIEDTIFEKHKINTKDSKGEEKLWHSLRWNAIQFAIKKDSPAYKRIKDEYPNHVANKLAENTYERESSNIIYNHRHMPKNKFRGY